MDRLARRSRLTVASLVVAISMASASTAHADPESDAKDLFNRARELRQKGDCATASPLFQKAYAVHPRGLGSLRNFAECEEAIGHYASSRRAWLDLKRALVTEPPSTKYDGWEGEAEANAARLRPKVAAFVVDVYVKSPEGEALATDGSGVELFVNGESIGTRLAGTPLERDPGTYRIRAQVKDAPPVEQAVPLNAGDNPHVTLRLVRNPAVAAAGVAKRPDPGGSDVDPPREPERSGDTQRLFGWAAIGVGSAALVTSAVTILVRGSALSEIDERCPSRTNCPRDLEDTADRGRLMSTLTNVFVPLGVVGLGAGITLLATAPSSQRGVRSATATGATLTAGPGRLNATWRF